MKKLLLIFVIVIITSGVDFGQTQVLSGNWGASSDSKTYTLNQNTGERSITVEINFLKPFKVKPEVLVGLSSIDVDKSTAVRYSVKAISVSRDGFTVEVKTWGDTKINSITGFWLAHAE